MIGYNYYSYNLFSDAYLLTCWAYTEKEMERFSRPAKLGDWREVAVTWRIE